jgi:hypothetical protein
MNFELIKNSQYNKAILRLKKLNKQLIVIIFMISLTLGSFFSLFLRDFQENLDDKVNFFLATLPNSQTFLEQQLKATGDNSVYGFWRIGLLDNYPILKLIFLIYRNFTSFQFLDLHDILIISASFLFLVSFFAILWFGFVLIKSKVIYRFNFALLIFTGSVMFAMVCTSLGEIMKNRLSSLGIVGLDTAPYGLSVLGTLLSAGLDLSFIGSTPRGSSLLCIMAMWIALLGGKTRLAIISAALALVIHISYGVIAIILLYSFIIITKSVLNFKNSTDLFLLFTYAQTLLYFYRPPAYFIYSILILSMYLFYYLSKIFLHKIPSKLKYIEVFIYFVYLFAAIFKILLLPEIGVTQAVEKFFGLKEGWALFITEFPRRIALITAPLCVLTLSFTKFHFVLKKYSKILNFSALTVVIIITTVFSSTIFTTGFPISKTIDDLDVGSGSSIYLSTISAILRS